MGEQRPSPSTRCDERHLVSWAINGLIIDLVATIDLFATLDLIVIIDLMATIDPIESQRTFHFWHDPRLDFGIIRTWHSPP